MANCNAQHPESEMRCQLPADHDGDQHEARDSKRAKHVWVNAGSGAEIAAAQKTEKAAKKKRR